MNDLVLKGGRVVDPAQGLDKVTDIAVVVVLLVIATRIRRGPLGPPSLWLDDAWPALVTRVPWSRIQIVGLTSPGYSAILKAWTHVVGFSNTHAQEPALAFGVLGPAAVYLTGRRLALRILPAAVAATILLATRQGTGSIGSAFRAPPWMWAGGVFGLIVVFTITFAQPKIGATATIGILIAGQLAIGAVIDRFGLFGVDQIAISWPRALGIALLGAGAALSLAR